MAKIIPFPQPKISKKAPDPSLHKLKSISDEIDKIIVNTLETGAIRPAELIGVLAHRLGALLKHFDGKAKLWNICERVLKKQASIEDQLEAVSSC